MKSKAAIAMMVLIAWALCSSAQAQTLFVPGTLTGIGNSTTALSVGVGTSNPRARLEVFSYCSAGGASPTILATRPGGLACPLGSSLGSYFEAREYNLTNTAFTTKFIVNSAGRVGIGTGAPATELHLVGNSYTTGKASIGVQLPSNAGTKLHVQDGAIMVAGSNSNGGPMILFSDNTSTHPNGRWGIEYVPNKGLNFWKPYNAGMGGGTNYHMFIKDDGKVSIGIDPDDLVLGVMPNSMPNGYRLFVKEGILAEKVRVAVYGTSFWADDVFDDKYERNSIEYVAEYTRAHKHLPNVPSAEEVCASGIDVAQMDAALLRQVEELWLHVIDLKKENEALRLKLDQR